MEEILEITKRFLNDKVEPFVDEWEKREWFPNSIFKDLAEVGILGLIIPERYGGLGLSHAEALKWCETLGEVPCLGFTVGICMSFLVCANAINTYGTDEQKNEYLEKIVNGSIVFAYAFTEPIAGSDLKNISSTARKINGKFRLTGSKIFITNGVRADKILVFARVDDSYGIFIVPKEQISSVSKLKKLGWYASDTAILTFENSEVELLGEELGQGWSQVLSSLSFERLMLCALGIGLIRKGIKLTLNFAENRVIKSKKLSENKLFHSFITRSIRELDLFSKMISIATTKDDIVFSAALKAYVCDRLFWISDQLLQFHGGYGYTQDYLIERILRDIRLLPIGGGAREPLFEYVTRRVKKTMNLNTHT